MASPSDECEPISSPKSLSPRLKRRKIVDSSDEHVNSEEPSKKAASRDMHRSTTPPGSTSNIRFTKTGRISKATKGERVHACDECGKVYTRAEHLRRHKKNHSQGTLLCNWPGCGRSFFREDLLQRHKQRHNDNDSSPRSRGSSGYRARGTASYETNTSGNYTERRVLGNTIVGNMSHETDSAIHTTSETATVERPYHAQPLRHANTMPISQKTSGGYAPFDLLPRRRIASVANAGTYGSAPTSEWMSPRRNSSPLRNVSPHQPYYAPPGQQVGLGNDSSFDQYPYPNASRSPLSAESLPVMTTVGENTVHQVYGATSTPTSDGSTTGPTRHTLYEVTPLPGITTVNLDERDTSEQLDLQAPMAVITASELGGDIGQTVYECEERFIAAYWQSVHVLWPVVHRPTFNTTRNPLLKAAIVALGAQSTGDQNDLSTARLLNEKCMKVLKKRTNYSSHSYRICDMQAVVLVELYSLYKARRPSLRLTSCFEQVYRRLTSDPDANPAQAVDEYSTEDFSDMLSGLLPEVRKEAKRRLLIACYILDQQNSTFFGRKTMEIALPVSYIPFPQPSNVWNASSGASTSTAYGRLTMDTAQHEYTCEALNTITTHEHPSTSPYDVFRSSLLIATMRDVAEGQGASTWKPLDDAEASALLYVVDNSARTQLAYHLFMLCKNTPVRDLLAVAGETWIMSEKVASQAVYRVAQAETKSWAADNTAGSFHNNALYHALHILEIVRTSTTPGLLYREWAVYMASLVVWITSYVAHEGQPRGRPGSMSQHELDRVVLAVTDAGPSTLIGWNDASNVLLWTQRKLEVINVPNHCGLINGALDVINKLVSRGHEVGWLE